MIKIRKYFIALGMLGVIFYLAHTILGSIMWKEYNPITTDISTLTADGSPNAKFLRILGLIYGICMIFMALGLILKSINQDSRYIKTGYNVLMFMQLISLFGYSLFPLSENKIEMGFQNKMHILVTIIVVFSTIISLLLISIGHLKKRKTRHFGKIILFLWVLIIISGILNPICMILGLNILGITERINIYIIQLFMFVLSFYYTFLEDKANSESHINLINK